LQPRKHPWPEPFHEPSLGKRMNEQVLIKSKEAAKLLAVCPRTLHSLTHGGGLPFVRMGRCLRYHVAELAKWTDVQTRLDAPPSGSPILATLSTVNWWPWDWCPSARRQRR